MNKSLAAELKEDIDDIEDILKMLPKEDALNQIALIEFWAKLKYAEFKNLL